LPTSVRQSSVRRPSRERRGCGPAFYRSGDIIVFFAETTTTATPTTTSSFEDVDAYLSRLSTLLELMYAASELSDDTETGAQYQPQIRRVRRSASARRYRRSSMQRAKQVVRKCCLGCSYTDIETLC